MIKSFRGKLADGGQTTIRLSTNQGLIGYRIIKLSIVTASPGTNNGEHVLKLYKYEQTTIDANINFEDPTLLGIALTHDYTNAYQGGWNEHIIFDNEIFNQDIFVTHKDLVNALDLNYYIELEQVKLAVDEAAVATLKDMRGFN